MKMKKMTKILVFIAILSLSLLLYPTFSNYWNQKHATRAINSYVKEMSVLDDETHDRMIAEANAYNKEIYLRRSAYTLDEERREKYEKLLDPSGTGVMGYVEIAKLGVTLPLYHGTDDGILQIALGHLEWSSLPVGGENTHSVISGHRGLPCAKLFTDLDVLREGDTFSLSILGDDLIYEVDQILTVLPDETSSLLISEGKDYCTLVTCTPYGINTHRLLVRGHRVESHNAVTGVVSEAVIVDQLIVSLFLAIPLLFLLFLAVMLRKPQKKVNIDSLLAKEMNDET